MGHVFFCGVEENGRTQPILTHFSLLYGLAWGLEGERGLWDILYGSGVNNLNIARELLGAWGEGFEKPDCGQHHHRRHLVRQGRGPKKGGGWRWVFHTAVWLKSVDVLSFVASVVVVVVVVVVFLS